jgi:hypothetical protein
MRIRDDPPCAADWSSRSDASNESDLLADIEGDFETVRVGEAGFVAEGDGMPKQGCALTAKTQ